MPQHVFVSDYDSSWPKKYRKERSLVSRILGNNLIAIYHIGSTSVPGLAAKPIIDIMAVVRSLAEADGTEKAFAAIGYEWLGEYGIEGRRYLRKGGDERTHQIHIFQADDSGNIIRHLAFRSYLEKHRDVLDEYAALKKELALHFPYDIDGYCDGKDGFVRSVEKAALAEYDSSWDRLYIEAGKHLESRIVSPFVESGSVAAVILTESGKIFSGICFDTACSLGMCAERNAIGNMLTAGENHIRKLVVVMENGELSWPCGSCRELMMQLDEKAADIEILVDYYKHRTISLGKIQKWWGKERWAL